MADNTNNSEELGGDFLFQVQWFRKDDGEMGVNVEFGIQLEEEGKLASDEMKLYALSQMMNSLALRLAGSSIGEEIEDD